MRHAAIIMEESSKTKMQFHPGSSIFPTTPQMDQPPPVPSPSTFGNILDRHLDTAVESDEEHDLRLVNEPVAVELTDNIAVGNRPSNFVLAFTNLSYAVWKPRGLTILPWQRTALIDPEQASTRRKTLLDSITGEVRNGEILAVLGASGSGKSTLIDALANRIERTSLEGDITLNGESLDGQVLKVISAYVMQDDLLFPMLTVEETLMFAAELRLPRSVSATKKRERVQNLINQLGLHAAAKTIIGDEGHRGVSGGERRRVSIGTDIVHDPVILFLDEPTSGLDSTSAFMVVKVLQGIARRGSIVVMSVHQPSFRILGLLDRLLFLSRGQNVYRGTPAGLPGFFAEFGRSIPAGENPAEFALDLIRELEGTANGAKALVDFNKWRQAPEGSTGSPPLSLKDAMWNSISQGRLVGSQRLTEGAALKSSSPRKFANPPWKEVLVLSKRSFTNIRRMPEILALRLATVIVSSFILGTLFWHPGESPKGVTERLGFFAIGITIVFFTCADALPVFIQERYIFMRETAYNAYRRSSYVFSNAITGVPSLILLAAAFSLLTFYGVGLAGGAGGLAFFFLVILACFWAGSGFVTFLSGTFSHVVLGYTVAAAVLCYYLLFSGFFINRNRLPGYWIWFHYLSMVKYSYEAAVENEFGGGGGIRCFSRGVQMFDGTLLGGLDVDKKVKLLGVISKTLQMNLTTQSCVVTGSDVLQQQSIGQLSKWSGLLVTVGWGFLFRLLFYVSLLLGSRNKRK